MSVTIQYPGNYPAYVAFKKIRGVYCKKSFGFILYSEKGAKARAEQLFKYMEKLENDKIESRFVKPKINQFTEYLRSEKWKL
jgi:hypothetical protein